MSTTTIEFVTIPRAHRSKRPKSRRIEDRHGVHTLIAQGGVGGSNGQLEAFPGSLLLSPAGAHRLPFQRVARGVVESSACPGAYRDGACLPAALPLPACCRPLRSGHRLPPTCRPPTPSRCLARARESIEGGGEQADGRRAGAETSADERSERAAPDRVVRYHPPLPPGVSPGAVVVGG